MAYPPTCSMLEIQIILFNILLNSSREAHTVLLPIYLVHSTANVTTDLTWHPALSLSISQNSNIGIAITLVMPQAHSYLHGMPANLLNISKLHSYSVRSAALLFKDELITPHSIRLFPRTTRHTSQPPQFSIAATCMFCGACLRPNIILPLSHRRGALHTTICALDSSSLAFALLHPPHSPLRSWMLESKLQLSLLHLGLPLDS